MRVELFVPATIANLGPIHGVAALALDVGDTWSFAIEGPAGRIELDGQLLDPDHPLQETYDLALARFGGSPRGGLRVALQPGFPRGRGLGAAVSARIAGLYAWRIATGRGLSRPAALALLSDAHGRAHQVAAALLGGLCLAREGREGPQVQRLSPPELEIALVIPSVVVPEVDAILCLPCEVPLEDASWTAGAAAILVAGLLTGDMEAVAAGSEDRLYQPYRAPLIGPVEGAFEAAREAGGRGAFICGRGSSLAAWVPRGREARAVAQAMCAVFDGVGVPAEARTARPASQGAWEVMGGKLPVPPAVSVALEPGPIDVLGIDWSGAAEAGRRTWLAMGTLVDGRLHVHRLLRAIEAEARTTEEVIGRVAARVRAPGTRLVGIDAPLGLPVPVLDALGVADTPALIDLLDRLWDDPERFRARCSALARQATGQPEPRRKTDQHAGTPWCPWNLRLYRQTWAAFQLLQALEGDPRVAVLPFTSAAAPVRLAEVSPTAVVAMLPVEGRGYKRRGEETLREAILEAAAGTWGLSLDPEVRAQAVADPGGDAVDAILAALSAAFGLSGLDPVPADPVLRREGWVAMPAIPAWVG